jgi:hypothetical protein
MDLRIPIGLLFVLLGALLTGYGLLGDPAVYAASLGVNVNLRWGIVMLFFGAAMLGTAWAGRRKGEET